MKTLLMICAVVGSFALLPAAASPHQNDFGTFVGYDDHGHYGHGGVYGHGYGHGGFYGHGYGHGGFYGHGYGHGGFYGHGYGHGGFYEH